MRNKIGECLLQAGIVTEDDVRRALAEHERTGERIGAIFVRLNLATENQIATTLALQLGFPYVNLTETPPDPSVVTLIPKEVAIEHACIATSLQNDVVTLAMSDPLLFGLVQDLERQTGYRVKQVVGTRGEILAAIETSYGSHTSAAAPTPVPAPSISGPSTSAVEGSTVDALLARLSGGLEQATGQDGGGPPIADLVDYVVKGAVAGRASDVHIEPMEDGIRIRHRVDGVLVHVSNLPKSIQDALTARLKTMAGMDVGETRLPQDGRLRAGRDDGGDVDFRVSTLRTRHGEKIVMRLLDHRKRAPALEDLGMSPAALEDVHGFLRQPHGMILVVGPAGSGRTATVNSMLTAVQSERTDITTIEDPVEYHIPGVNQIQIDGTVDGTFADALRSILRQDPDVVLLGEIADADAAAVAMLAAQTRQLVLSTFLAGDAASAVTRLAEIGGEPFQAASALVGVVAQRLVRRLCTRCRREEIPSMDALRSLKFAESDAWVFYRAVGCDDCSHTGYRGRVGIFEVMRITDPLRRQIADGATDDQIRIAALEGGMTTLGEDGLAKVRSGVTTLDELLRVVDDVGEMRTVCDQCGAAIGPEFNACPHCGKRQGPACPHCGRGLQPGWKFCPYCARGTHETTGAPKPPPERDPDRQPGRPSRRNVTKFRR